MQRRVCGLFVCVFLCEYITKSINYKYAFAVCNNDSDVRECVKWADMHEHNEPETKKNMAG